MIFWMQLARLQAMFTVLWLVTALTWAVANRASFAWAVGGVLVMALSHAVVLGLEFVAQRHVSRHDAVPAPSAARLWRAWAAEVLAAPRLFCWRQPFRSRRHADRLAGLQPGLRGVVLVPGYLCNRGAWNAWLQCLEQQGRPFIALDLEPVFGSIDGYVPLIEAAVTRMTQATGQAPLLVGHSMGGLALRAWLAHARAPERAHRLVTLGTPHRGTWLARWGHTCNARQMRPHSAWLQTLAERTPCAWHAHFVCFYSNADNIVFPPSHAMLDGADNRLVPGLAHVQLADEPDVIAAALELLDAPPLGGQADNPDFSQCKKFS